MSSLQQWGRSILWMRHIPGIQTWNRLRYRREHPLLEREQFGILFPHPVGLAPVLERQVDILDECESIGFSFTTVIPGQSDVNHVAQRLQERTSPIITGVELRAEGSSEEEAKKALIRLYSLLYDFADYFILDVNWESGQSSLDDFSDWTDLLDEILNLRLCYEKYTPILLRISPSHSDAEMSRILDFSLLSGIDGIVAPGIAKVRFCRTYSKERMPVIGSGALAVAEEAVALLQAGACLVEVGQGDRKYGCLTARRLLSAIDNPFDKL